MLLRLFLVPLGLLLAATAEIVFLPLAALFDPATRAAGLALGHAGFFALLEALTGGDADVGAIGAALSTGFVAICLVPLVIVALIGEVARVRSGLFYLIGTGGLAAAMPFVLRASLRTGALAPNGTEQRFLLLFFLTGAIGGSLYWLIAGRSAMRRREPVRQEPPPLPPPLPPQP